MIQELGGNASRPVGAQTIGRAISALRLVAASDNHGAHLTDIVAAMGIPQPTVLRMPAVGVRKRVIEQEPGTRLYHLGPEINSFGLVAATRPGLYKLAIPPLVRLAEISQNTVFLTVPSGTDGVCLHREEGSFPIHTQVLSAGRRYPLGIGAGSLALLAAMSDREVERIINANAGVCGRNYPVYPPRTLLSLVERTRSLGYAINEGWVMSDSWAVGVAILNQQSQPVAALSIGATASRMAPARQQELAALLKTESHALSEAMQHSQTAAPPRDPMRVATSLTFSYN
jgi:DNA-binding IclR family transcriptional regulator